MIVVDFKIDIANIWEYIFIKIFILDISMMTSTSILFTGEPQRIDQWLTQQFPYSRNFFHHIISRGGVQVNGQIVKKSYKLKTTDQVYIDNLQRYVSPILLEESPKFSLPILIETEDYLIINKPKGVLSHPNSIRDIASPSVVGFLYHHYKSLPSIGNFIRAGLVHRLDKDTDGLMIVAKTELWLSHFKWLFQQKSLAQDIIEKEKIPLKKQYQAKCYMTPEWEKTLKTREEKWFPYYISALVIPKIPYAHPKLGITKILGYSREDNRITFEIEILTGRTHQIRYHLSQVWFPIVGDYLYWKEEEIPLQLTATKLSFQEIWSEKIINIDL